MALSVVYDMSMGMVSHMYILTSVSSDLIM